MFNSIFNVFPNQFYERRSQTRWPLSLKFIEGKFSFGNQIAKIYQLLSLDIETTHGKSSIPWPMFYSERRNIQVRSKYLLSI